jgi:hypothetical protein
MPFPGRGSPYYSLGVICDRPMAVVAPRPRSGRSCSPRPDTRTPTPAQLEGGRGGLCCRSQNRCWSLGQHGLGIRYVQGDGKGRRRRDRQVSIGLSQERWKVALHPRYLECGRAACASRSSCGAASGKEIGCDFLRTSGPRVTSSGSSAATSVPCRLTLEPDGPARDFNLASIGAARRLA